MKERIMLIMKEQGMNQKEFSALTGISPATLSSIFNGRTQPTLNHVEALLRRFPNLSWRWLVLGDGEMYESRKVDDSDKPDVVSGMPNLFTLGKEVGNDGPTPDGVVSTAANLQPGVIREVVKYVDKPQRKITEIRIFFDDGTFETFPGK